MIHRSRLETARLVVRPFVVADVPLLAGLLAFAAERGIAAVRATVDPENGVSVHLLRQAGFALAEQGYGGEAGSDLYLRSG